MSNQTGRRAYLLLGLSGALVVVAAVTWGLISSGALAGSANGHHDVGYDDDIAGSVVTLRAVKPHRNQSELLHEVMQPAFVQAYHKADLMARVAGTVKAVHKEIGDQIRKGELLLEVDVPDLDQELAQKQAMVYLAEQEARAAQAALVGVQAAAREAAALVTEKLAEVDRTRARHKYAQAVYVRIRKLAADSAVEPSLVDERLRNLEAAEAEVKSAAAAVNTTRANVEESDAKVQQAKIDVEVKAARVKVARADEAKARAMLELSKIRAPFDGLVVKRDVDPGSFVQDASSGRGSPLLSVIRTDRVTLVMWVPEREAPLVQSGQEATIRLDALRGKEITSAVTRFSQWLNPDRARDMRVEVDLDNTTLGLRVGMYGSMRIVLQQFDKAWLLPASAVFVRGGQTLICEVVDGHAKMRRVRVLYEDGIKVLVAKLEKRADLVTHQEVDVESSLTGDEVIVRSGQGELRDGQEVRVSLSEW